MEQTQAEKILYAALGAARNDLMRRDYETLEGRLSKAALDARSLRLLGPEGARGIPVDYEVDQAAINDRLARIGLDSPAGAGADVEAERG